MFSYLSLPAFIALNVMISTISLYYIFKLRKENKKKFIFIMYYTLAGGILLIILKCLDEWVKDSLLKTVFDFLGIAFFIAFIASIFIFGIKEYKNGQIQDEKKKLIWVSLCLIILPIVLLLILMLIW